MELFSCLMEFFLFFLNDSRKLNTLVEASSTVGVWAAGSDGSGASGGDGANKPLRMSSSHAFSGSSLNQLVSFGLTF